MKFHPSAPTDAPRNARQQRAMQGLPALDMH